MTKSTSSSYFPFCPACLVYASQNIKPPNISSSLVTLKKPSKINKTMELWIEILAGLVPATAILISLLLFLCHRRRQQQQSHPPESPAQDPFQKSIHKLHLTHKPGSKSSLRFHPLHQETSFKHEPPPPPFSWDHHPRLVSEAAENGWSHFVFVDSTLVPRSPPLWGLCTVCDGWDVPRGSSEFMQTVRINPSPNSPLCIIDGSSFSCIRMSLPLPGPHLISMSFPQEAYFEITVLYLKLKPLIKEISNTKPVVDNVLVSLGLTRGGGSMLAGTFPGSIAFHSDGSVYLDGLQLASESEKTSWAAVNRVIGCGFNPNKKKVFFTVDSELVHVIRCNSDSFKSPMYQILSSNSDMMVLVNLGRVAFKYVIEVEWPLPSRLVSVVEGGE